MENPQDIARASWGEAQRVRSDILGKISSLKKERGNTNYTTRFEEVEQTMAEFRLACMQVIFHDFEYAVDKKVEHSLWQAHTFLNGEYRKVMSRLMAQNQVVQRRKLDKLYRAFLKTSESFYRVYIQRLSARFYIPELRQAAYGTELGPTETLSDDVSPPAPLRAMVLKSCQTTLVRLGDLARYRCQISDKLSKATFDKALDYYGLANTIDPDDGSAHHQMAVLHQLQGQHLDIVYHFHRAISIARPHELALGNLEREFRGLENSSHSSKKGPVKDPSEAMVAWFVRLHAFFFQGEQFSQQSELEKEVLHRMEIAMKSDGTEVVLRKMILINIAAYDVATEKVKASWTMTGSQSCQFLLRFNICTILILLRLLKNALRDEPTESSNEGDGSEGILMFTPAIMRLLPLLRIYISWIYVTRADIVQYQDYLEPFVKDVYRHLADTVTLLNTFVDETKAASPSKYLLPEDAEALGLRSLCDRKLPLFLQVEEHHGSTSSKRQKTRKPRQIVFGCQFQPQTEAVWRIRDIVCCGVFLAGSAKFPLTLMIESQDGHDYERWICTDEAPVPVCSDELGMARILAKLSLGDVKTAPENPVKKGVDLVPVDGIPEGPSQPPAVIQSDTVPSPGAQVDKGKSLEKPQENFLEPDLSEDSDMINMVDSLVGPVEDSHSRTSQAYGDTNYGMNSSTANDIFRPFNASPAQPSPVSKAIPSLPWDYFYTPTPHRSNSQGQNQLSPIGDYVPRSAAGQLDGFDSSSYLDHLDTPYQQAANVPFTSNAQHHVHRGSRVETGYGYKSMSPPGAPNSNSLDSLETSRNAVLDSLSSALRAQHGFAPSKAQPSESLSTRTPWSPMRAQRSNSSMSGSSFPRGTSSPKLADPKNQAVSNYMERSGSQLSATKVQSPIGPPGQGRPGGRQAAPAGQLSKTISPITNSFDLQRMSGQGFSSIGTRDVSSGPFQQQYSSWLQEHPASGSSLVFSQSSSLYGGTPAAAAAPGGPPHSVACNGNFFNASTPFGRLGEGTNNRDDPTHFRNQLKAATGNTQLSYDQQILQAALMDNSSKQRPK
ncbi:hypothetical protein F5X99DRAFT_368491 [Biscogniauxia marginata]|nr:hypothetical protein F5X99DRAFT_368491 [Biscogniauxia marginata]